MDDMNDLVSHDLELVDSMNNSWFSMKLKILCHEPKALNVMKNSLLWMT